MGKKNGNIDELVINRENDFITHLVMRYGHIFGKKEISVPNINIKSFDEHSVNLNIGEK